MIGSTSAALYFTKSTTIVTLMPPLTSIAMIMLSSNVVVLIMGVIFVPSFQLGLDPAHGAFGFFYYESYLYVLFGVGLVGGALCYGTYGFILKYFSPIVLCTAFLFEPFISQTIGCMMGLDKSPGFLTILGTLITLVGLYQVGVGGKKKTKITGEL
jgi:hypothetical protein